jgi:glycosyltransferase involved in cell wall biosynthesis
MKKKISVITINLNNIKGLEKTLESVFNQIFQNLEYIVIDGGSTDGSEELLRKYGRKISYWISEPDNGIYQAMNKGIRAAKGEYLLFLNSGDFLVDNNVLKEVFKEDHTEDILWGTSRYSRNGQVLFSSPSPEKLTLKFFYNQTISHQSTFIRGGLFKEYGYYREDFKINSDYEFWIRTIILNNCSTKKLNILVSDYNLEGLSGSQNNLELSREENKKILTLSIPQRILDDYSAWMEERKQLEVMYWFKSKQWIYRFLIFLHKTVINFILWKKRLRNKSIGNAELEL